MLGEIRTQDHTLPYGTKVTCYTSMANTARLYLNVYIADFGSPPSKFAHLFPFCCPPSIINADSGIKGRKLGKSMYMEQV